MRKKSLMFFSFSIIILLLIGSTTNVAYLHSIEIDNQAITPPRYQNKIDLLMNLLMRISRVPSVSACVIKDEEIIWSNAYGYYNIKEEKRATETTLYNIASISKPITATALLQLYEQGLFELDEDINTFLPFTISHPDYPNTPITFRMLLAHQSGLSEDPLAFYTYFPKEECPIPLYPWIETYLTPDGANYTHRIWSSDAPGESFHYANVGYALIGYLVEQISEQPFHQYCQEHIFNPLNMDNTSYLLKDLDLSCVAMPYQHILNINIPRDHYCYLGYPCGSVHTSVKELAHFIIAHMNQGRYRDYQLLNASTITLSHTMQYQEGQYGFGWFIKNNSKIGYQYGHTGGDKGITTNVVIQEKDDTAVIYFTNGRPRGPIQTNAWILFQTVLFSII